MFTPEQIAALRAPLDSSHVKQRSQAGRQLSYVEGWHAIAEANRIFGFDGWTRETLEIKQLHEPYQNEKGNWVVGYMSKSRICVGALVREGCGFGSGIDRDLGRAHESAIKESETDSMKRALMTFGNPFGLALYDKEQREVTNGGGTATPSGDAAGMATTAHTPPPAKMTPQEWAVEAQAAIDRAKTINELQDWKAASEKALTKLSATNPALRELVLQAYDRAKVELAEVNSMAAA